MHFNAGLEYKLSIQLAKPTAKNHCVSRVCVHMQSLHTHTETNMQTESTNKTCLTQNIQGVFFYVCLAIFFTKDDFCSRKFL